MEECSNNMERLLTISFSHNGATPVTLALNTYDALGRLATNSVNNEEKKKKEPSLWYTNAKLHKILATINALPREKLDFSTS